MSHEINSGVFEKPFKSDREEKRKYQGHAAAKRGKISKPPPTLLGVCAAAPRFQGPGRLVGPPSSTHGLASSNGRLGEVPSLFPGALVISRR